ncbi:MAG: YlxR family protein [Chloroflexota bacterium]
MCAVCRDKAGKRTLTRVVRTEAGLQVDPSGKMNGRGAYLCERESCWETAVKTDLLAKALRMPLTETDRERLRRARA